MSDRFSLADLERYDPHAPAGKKERRFLCPACGDDKPRDRAHRSFAVNTGTGAYKCHRCAVEGKLTDYWEDRPRTTRAERSRAALARAFALPERKTPAAKPEPTPDDREREARWRATWESSVDLTGTPGAAYVEGRAIPCDLAAAAGVRFSPVWYGRPAVLFPVVDRGGALVAVSGRFIDGRDDPKTQTGGHKSAGIFPAIPGALEARCLAICEGQFDALALAACGVPAIALIGTSWPDWLPRALAFRSVLIATDNDTAGDRAALSLGPELATRGARAIRLRPKNVKDWGEALENGKLALLRTHLRGFASMPGAVRIEDAGQYQAADIEALTDDDVRICAARELAEAGRIEAARFITRLLEDRTLEATVNRHLERLAGGRDIE